MVGCIPFFVSPKVYDVVGIQTLRALVMVMVVLVSVMGK